MFTVTCPGYPTSLDMVKHEEGTGYEIPLLEAMENTREKKREESSSPASSRPPWMLRKFCWFLRGTTEENECGAASPRLRESMSTTFSFLPSDMKTVM
jgi:hypothetical protein